MKIYFKTISMHIKSALEYKKSFIFMSIASFILTFLMIAAIYLLFDKFGQVEGWTFYEVALTFGIIMFCFAFIEMSARGLDHFHTIIRNGDFDRILLKPANLLIQATANEFEPSKIGRIIQSLLVLIYAMININVEWTFYKILIVIFMIIAGIIIFFSILVMKAAFSFWTVEGLEFMNILSEGGKKAAQYPIDIYNNWFAKFFTYVVPFGLINYYPLLYILGKNDNPLFGLAPIVACLFIVPALVVWKIGIKHYTSTGS